MTNIICPANIIRAIPILKEIFPSTIELLPSYGIVKNLTAHFKKIEFKVDKAVFYRRLLCRDINIERTPDECPYLKYQDKNAKIRTCSDAPQDMAHIYFQYEKGASPCCIIMFVGKSQLCDAPGIGQRFTNTLAWLGITEKPDFRVIHPELNNHDINTTAYRRRLEKEMKGKCSTLKIIKNEKNNHRTLSVEEKNGCFKIEAC